MELKGKIIDFLGDSITEGVGVEDIENCRYDNVIHRRFDLAAHYNYGVGGTRLAHQSVPSEKPRYDLCFCGRAYHLEPSADVIVVYGGVNDYIHGDAYFGTPLDRTPATYCGAVHFLMEFLKITYPQSTIVFMTPAHMHFRGDSDKFVSPRPIKKPDAQPLYAYVDVIKEKGMELGVHVLDLFENLPIDPNNESDRIKYTTDGLHLNDLGHTVLAEVLGDFLEQI